MKVSVGLAVSVAAHGLGEGEENPLTDRANQKLLMSGVEQLLLLDATALAKGPPNGGRGHTWGKKPVFEVFPDGNVYKPPTRNMGYSTPPNAPTKGFQAPGKWTVFPDDNEYANPVPSKGYKEAPPVKTWSPPVPKPSLYSQGYTGKPKERDTLQGIATGYQPPAARPSLYSQGYMGKKTYKPPQAKPTLYSQGFTGVKDGPWKVKKSYTPPRETKPYNLDDLPKESKAGYYFSPKDPEKVAQEQAKRTALNEMRKAKRAEKRSGSGNVEAAESAATAENEAPAAPEEKEGLTSPA